VRNSSTQNAYVKAFRRLLWERDGGICGICQGGVDLSRMHIDHITPIKLGGSDEWENLQPAHPPCNTRKGWKTMKQVQAKEAARLECLERSRRQQLELNTGSAPSAIMTERMYTVRESAAQIGAQEETIRRWLRDKKIEGVMPGGQKLGYRIPEREIERILRVERRCAASEPEAAER
jgi:excisionase family DNA binding protein